MLIKKGQHLSPNTEFKKGKHYSIETEFKKELHSSSKTEFKKGYIPWNKNKKGLQKMSEETKIKMRNAHLGKKNHFYGRHHLNITKIKMSETHVGEKCYNWQGGKSFEPYGVEFNDRLREKVRQRDNYKCQNCDCPEKENIILLNVHHIDYNKQNNKEENLISLCRSCHIKTNHNREYWTNYFNKEVLNV